MWTFKLPCDLNCLWQYWQLYWRPSIWRSTCWTMLDLLECCFPHSEHCQTVLPSEVTSRDIRLALYSPTLLSKTQRVISPTLTLQQSLVTIRIWVIGIVELPDVRFQTASRLEVSQTLKTPVFEAHQVSLYMHSHVTFLFYFFMTLTAAPDNRPSPGITFIHQALQLRVKFCKKIPQISVSQLIQSTNTQASLTSPATAHLCSRHWRGPPSNCHTRSRRHSRPHPRPPHTRTRPAPPPPPRRPWRVPPWLG